MLIGWTFLCLGAFFVVAYLLTNEKKSKMYYDTQESLRVFNETIPSMDENESLWWDKHLEQNSELSYGKNGLERPKFLDLPRNRHTLKFMRRIEGKQTLWRIKE